MNGDNRFGEPGSPTCESSETLRKGSKGASQAAHRRHSVQNWVEREDPGGRETDKHQM